MKSMINVGNDINNNEVTIAALAEALVSVIKAGAETRTEQETIRTALKAVGEIAQVSGVTITNSTFSTNDAKPLDIKPDPTVSLDDDDDLDD